MKAKTKLICLFGHTGSGRGAVAQSLARVLWSRGYPTEVYRLKDGPRKVARRLLADDQARLALTDWQGGETITLRPDHADVLNALLARYGLAPLAEEEAAVLNSVRTWAALVSYVDVVCERRRPGFWAHRVLEVLPYLNVAYVIVTDGSTSEEYDVLGPHSLTVGLANPKTYTATDAETVDVSGRCLHQFITSQTTETCIALRLAQVLLGAGGSC